MNTVGARYEVAHPDYGVIEHVPTRDEAETVAKNYCTREKVDHVEVFDRMAHKGKAELWRVYVDDGKVYRWAVQRLNLTTEIIVP